MFYRVYQLLVSVFNISDLVKCIMFCHKVAERYRMFLCYSKCTVLS